jgi:hypothetical protein
LTVVPCQMNPQFTREVREFAEVLKRDAHLLGAHGMSQAEFNNSGLFRAAVERIRGQNSATMTEKRAFASSALNRLQQSGRIKDWRSSGSANRHDYIVTMPDGRIVGIELKGCLDGNNSTIFERPPQAREFYIWSVCTNPGSDLRKGVWSALHTRLGVQIIAQAQQLEGLIVWDMVCGTLGRPCPKLAAGAAPNQFEAYSTPPPCIYLLPSTVPHPRNNPSPSAVGIGEARFVSALEAEFGSTANSRYSVVYEVRYQGADIVRRTRVIQSGLSVRESDFVPIKRT